MKIIFMGTPDFAKESLEAIYNKKYDIIAVVTNPDKPKGRGMKMLPSPVKKFALEKNLKIYQPEKIRKNVEFIEELKNMNPDVICVVAYGKILPKEILEIPKLGCINVHGSLLPQYRGAAPIQWAVINGDKETGITTMYMDEGMDTGDMILKKKVEIGENETTGELWERLSKIGGELLVETLDQIERGIAPREKQGDNFTVAPMLDKNIAKIDWEDKTAKEIKNLVRGLNPIMGAYTFLNGKKIKFWKVDVANSKEVFVDSNMDMIRNGTVLVSDAKDGLFIKTKNGILEVIEIQGENANKFKYIIFDIKGGNVMEEENKINQENGEVVELEEEIKTENEGIKISNDVVAVIAGVAVSEVQGVSGMAGGFAGGISEVLSGKKNLAKGIKVEIAEKDVKIDVNIIVEYGSRIPDVAFEIQNRVKKAVENMTGLNVEEVNVHVQGVNTDTIKNEKEENIEQNQNNDQEQQQ